MADTKFVVIDQGEVNRRILAKEVKADFRRVEQASLKVMTRFSSAEAKRLFVRFFSTLQLNNHYATVIARSRLPHDDVERVERALRDALVAATEELNCAIDEAEELFKVNGITSLATYDTKPLEIEVGIISSTGRRFLEMLNKVDQIMPLIQTLEIHEAITSRDADIKIAGIKRLIRSMAVAARSAATKVRLRMKGIGFTEIDAGYGKFIGNTEPSASVGKGDLEKEAMGDTSETSSPSSGS